MMDLLKAKFEKITWTSHCHDNFEALKKTMMEALILRIMDPLKGGLVLCTDASDMAIGVILMRKNKIIGFESKKLSNAELNYIIYEK